MISRETFDFLRELRENNHKEWFDKNRKRYELVKEEYLRFISEILSEASEKADTLLQGTTAKECLFRINRDVRFSNDKSPYKVNLGASFSFKGKKILTAGYYLHTEPGDKSFFAGGIWMPDAPSLKKIRQEIDYNFLEFREIINNPSFLETFKTLDFSSESTLSRPPKGYDASNPAIEYLKLKSFITSVPLTDVKMQSDKIVKEVVRNISVLQPLVYFINRALEFI